MDWLPFTAASGMRNAHACLTILASGEHSLPVITVD